MRVSQVHIRLLRDNSMSKRSILIVGISLLVLGGTVGFGFWYVKQKPHSESLIQANSTQKINQQDSSDQSIGPIGHLNEKEVLQGAVSTSSGTSAQVAIKTVEANAVPQLVLPRSDKSEDPVYLYEGKAMTKQEYEKAWNTSSTNNGSGSTTKTSPPIQMDPASDKDHDGLSYEEEMKLGTDPNNADTDGDGLTDGQEVKVYKTDPKNFDTDSDGLTDGDEIKVYKTDPLKKDTDGDGFSDGQEVQSGYNPLGAGKLKK